MSPVNLDPWTDIVNVAWGGVFAVIVEMTIYDLQGRSQPLAGSRVFDLSPASPGSKMRKADWKAADWSEFLFTGDLSGGPVDLGVYFTDLSGDSFHIRRYARLVNLSAGINVGGSFFAGGTSHDILKQQNVAQFIIGASGEVSGARANITVRFRGYRAPTDFTVDADGFDIRSDAGSLVYDTSDITPTPPSDIGLASLTYLITRTGITRWFDE